MAAMRSVWVVGYSPSYGFYCRSEMIYSSSGGSIAVQKDLIPVQDDSIPVQADAILFHLYLNNSQENMMTF